MFLLWSRWWQWWIRVSLKPEAQNNSQFKPVALRISQTNAFLRDVPGSSSYLLELNLPLLFLSFPSTSTPPLSHCPANPFRNSSVPFDISVPPIIDWWFRPGLSHFFPFHFQLIDSGHRHWVSWGSTTYFKLRLVHLVFRFISFCLKLSTLSFRVCFVWATGLFYLNGQQFSDWRVIWKL